jgi:hypothetical protein
MAIDVSAVLGGLDKVNVVCTGEEADIVDEWDAGCKELDGTCKQVPVIVVADRRVVGTVDLQKRCICAIQAARPCCSAAMECTRLLHYTA